MKHDATCGILAGGASARMGRNKALLSFRGQPLVERQLATLRPLFERVLVGANEPGPYAPFGVEVVPDRLGERCALTGIHALLAAAATEHVFVVACDLPFLSARLIEALLERRGGADAVVPVSDRGPEPLHAVYGRACLAAIEASARRGDWKATAFHAAVRVDLWRVRDADWAVEGRSPFTNVNTPAEWDAAGP